MHNNKVLYGICTHGSPAYVELGLHYFKKYGRDVIVVDDGSKDPRLRELCKKYNVPLFGNCKYREPISCVGDVIGFLTILEVANGLGYDYCVKLSRRWICKEDPTPSLLKLAEETDGNTFSHITISGGVGWVMGFRTEFMGMRTKDWYANLDKVTAIPYRNSEPFVEAEMHQIAKQIQPTSDKYIHYRDTMNFVDPEGGYVHWEWMGNDRHNPPEYAMWHEHQTPEDYFKVAQSVGLNYTKEDFNIIQGQ